MSLVDFNLITNYINLSDSKEKKKIKSDCSL